MGELRKWLCQVDLLGVSILFQGSLLEVNINMQRKGNLWTPTVSKSSLGYWTKPRQWLSKEWRALGESICFFGSTVSTVGKVHVGTLILLGVGSELILHDSQSNTVIFQHFYFLPGFFTNDAWFSEASSLRVAKEKEVKSLGFSLLSPRCMDWWIGWVGWVDGWMAYVSNWETQTEGLIGGTEHFLKFTIGSSVSGSLNIPGPLASSVGSDLCVPSWRLHVKP